MKMLYITQAESDSGQFSWGDKAYVFGHEKKIRDQIEAFGALGIDTDYYNKLEFKKADKLSIGVRVIRMLPHVQTYPKIIYTDAINGYDAYYIRFKGADYPFYQFLKTLRANNPRAKILLEFPDMDYMQRLAQRVITVPLYWKNRHFLKKAEKLVDRSVTMNGSTRFLGFQNIPIINGIVTRRIKLPENEKKTTDNSLHLGIVATFYPVHGADILIEALHKYYLRENNHRKIYLHIVGTGRRMDAYRETVKNYHLEDFVLFHGYLSDAPLDAVYAQLDIGVCEMAAFRRSYPISSALKCREYLAKGLPIISSVKNDAIQEGYPYFKVIDTSDGTFDMNEIAAFYDAIFKQKTVKEVREEIRDYAEKTVEMTVTLKPIAEYLSASESAEV